jgi:cytochrome d ubiquinol oxidase subunit I
VYGVLRTADAVTPMPGLIVPFLAITSLYVFLGFVVAYLLYWEIFRTVREPGT